MNEESNKPEWQVIGKLVTSIQDEQRRSRRWGIFFKSLGFVFLFSVLAIAMSAVSYTHLTLPTLCCA